MRKVFTTGQVAKICQVASRTVCKWIDHGRLKLIRQAIDDGRLQARPLKDRRGRTCNLPADLVEYARRHDPVRLESLAKLIGGGP